VEAREIITLVNRPSETLTLIGTDANRARVATSPLHEYRIVHFATHALADSQDPALATLALSRWDAAGNSIDGALRLYDITQLRLNADLVVLSGCDTALGREIAGEGPIGLAQAFLRTGARSVVSTLWQVPDTSTAVLMREFYRQLLKNDQDAAVALQLAQDHIRRQARWSDPYFWAGFQLVSMARE
jgi:CHAT domain-containing protein